MTPLFSNLMNTWPNGHRHAMHQSDHEAWNASNYPGTRQLCVECDGETDRCEEDSIHTEDGHGPLCLECWHKTPEYILENAKGDGSPDEKSNPAK
jgi:hypothetical protein